VTERGQQPSPSVEGSQSIEGLLALRGQPPKFDLADAERVALEMYGLTATARALDGERDRNFRLDARDGRRFVLKFIDPEADDVVVAGQAAALAHIAEQDPGLGVPRLVAPLGGATYGPALMARAGAGGDSCRVRLVTYLAGHLVQDVCAAGAAGGRGQANAAGPARASGSAQAAGSTSAARPGGVAGGAGVPLLRSVGRQVASLDRALAGFFHPALAQPIAWDIRRAPSLMSALPHVKSAVTRALVERAFEPLQQLLVRMRGLRSQAIHGDCHARNLLVDASGDACVGIIDLGDMIHAPLALEIAVTMADFLVDGVASLDTLPELLVGYASVQPLERPDIDALYDLIATRIAVGVLIQAWREQNGPSAATSVLEEASAQALDAMASRGRAALVLALSEANRAAQADAQADARANVRADAQRADAGAMGAAATPATPATPAASTATAAGGPTLLRRRHAALGANAELSYDRPLHLVRGDGVWVFTSDGERLLDVYNNVPHVGHAHPAVVAAIAEQAKRIASNTRYLDERIIEYVERLTATLPPDLDTCLFVNSGSEANDIAWRIAKSHTGHEGALVMTFAYHGITDAVTALSPAICANVPPHVEQLAAPTGPPATASNAPATVGATVAAPPTGSAAPAPTGPAAAAAVATATAAESDVTAAIARLNARGYKPAALMIDSALTSTGIFDPPTSWIAPIATAVKKAGGLIIGDEVQFGLGRSGTDFWGFARRGYHPDIVTLGKPVGNGYPLGVVITRRAILEKFQRDTGFFSTFGGNPVAAAAGLAVLDVLERERLLKNAHTTGDYFINKLRALATKHDCIRDVRGRGLMIGVEVTDRTLTKRLVNGLRDRGVLIGSEGPKGNVLKLRPPMPFRTDHADIVVDALTDTLTEALTGALSAVRP